ncbi:MAG: hypothetical protein VKK04_17850 [Synechococcales bacterium]|nr:hypothetical protein [Synechococcales bacterium]
MMTINAEFNLPVTEYRGMENSYDLEFTSDPARPTHFDVMVTNGSDRPTPLQVELSVLDLDWMPDTKWYRVEPSIISRKIGNQITNFHIEILDLPSPQEGHLLKLCLRIISPEWEDWVEEKYLKVKVGDRQKARPVTSQIRLTEFRRELRFIPDSEVNPDSELDIWVTNHSDRFTSFKLELLPIDQNLRSDIQWYTVEPQVSTKKPPGETTAFRLKVIKEPIPAYDSTLDLILRIFSIEDEHLFVEEKLRLTIDPPLKPLRLALPAHTLKVLPGDGIDIPVLIHSLSSRRSQVTLCLTQSGGGTLSDDVTRESLPRPSVPLAWFEATAGLVPQKTVTLRSGESQQVVFRCCPPANVNALSQGYTFAVEARSNTSSYVARAIGELEVLPWGYVAMNGVNSQVTLPARNPHEEQYAIQFENQSNARQKVCLPASQGAPPSDLRVKLSTVGTLPQSPDHAPTVEVEASQTQIELVPGQAATITLKPTLKRSLLGWKRRHLLAIAPTLFRKVPGPALDLKPHQQLLELTVYPIIPWFLQVGGGLLLLLLLWLAWFLNPRGYHQGSINSVRLIGNGGTVVSGASDQTIRRWQVNPNPWMPDVRRLTYEGIIANGTGKAVRVIRQIPEHDHQIAAGLENGAIQLWDVALGRQLRSFTTQGNDRIFDLDFTRDSRYLLSGHGSGLVRLWDLESDRQTPIAQAYPKFAIAALAVQDEQPVEAPLVAIAGQYNSLFLWDWQQQQLHQVAYTHQNSLAFAPVVGQYDYLNSLDISSNQRRLVTADNQGYITLWDMQQLRQCVQANQRRFAPGSGATTDGMGNAIAPLNCDQSILDQWRDESNPQPVRSVALSQTGCHLASVGDDGRIRLWNFAPGADLQANHLENPVQLAQLPDTRLNSVDITETRDYLLIASDIDQNRIRLFRRKRSNHDANCQ